MKKDYFVHDEYGDVWNEEPLPTFNQAWDFRNYIRPLLFSRHHLSIKSVPRETVQTPQKIVNKPQYVNSDY